ncbi:MAG: tetratricopeptide repeat protein [Pseudomonadota bacterium]
MVDDILLTPEEQDERAKKWLKDNGPALVIGIVLGLGAVFGYNTYQDKLKSDAEAASALYDRVIELVRGSEMADISSQVETLKQDFSGSSYAAKAALLRARQLSVSDLDAALEELRWAESNSDEYGIKHTSRIRQAKVLIAQDKLDAAKSIASQTPYEGFASMYHELLGDIARKQGEFEVANSNYQTAIDELDVSEAGYRAVLTLKKDRLPVTSNDSTKGSLETAEGSLESAEGSSQTNAADADNATPYDAEVSSENADAETSSSDTEE